MRLAVRGIGVVGAFGSGVADLVAALEKGASPLSSLTIAAPQGPVEIPAFRAATDRLADFLPARSLRRMDSYSKLALLGASLALQDAGLLGSDLGRVGVIIASGYGATTTTFSFVDSMIADGDICASPTHFANSVHNSAAANISVLLKATGPSLTVSQFDLSVPSALVTARQWLAEKRVDAVLLGGVDELSDLVGYLWRRRYGSRHPQRISPLDFDRDSCIVGEGAAFLLLTPAAEGSGYCGIESVRCGGSMVSGSHLSDRPLFVIGADGDSTTGLRYRDLLPSGSGVACYTPLYGSMPAAAGLDLACAALMLQRGAAFPVPGAAGCGTGGSPALGESGVCVVRAAGAGGYSAVQMEPL